MPDAESSWYLVKTGDNEFRGKKIELFSGSLKIAKPVRDESINIPVLSAIDTSSIKQMALFDVFNQQELSASLINQRIVFKVNPYLTFILSKLDSESVYTLLKHHENFEDQIWELIEHTPEISKMRNELKSEKGEKYFVSAMSNIDWLPALTVYDGPSMHHKSNDTVSVYLAGYAKGNKMLNYWLTTFNGANPDSVKMYARLSDAKSGDKIDSFVIDINPNTMFFWTNVWATHDEFKTFWKQVHPKKAIPSLLLADAGIIVRTALFGYTYSSDILLGTSPRNYIMIRSDIFQYAFPPGQPVSASIGNFFE